MPETPFHFEGRNEQAQAVAARQAALLISRVTEETRQAIRGLILRSIREGIAPYDTARLIRDVIGLSGPQAQAAANYRASLVKSGLSQANIEKALTKYTDKQIRARSRAIARTEIMDALNAGVLEAGRQAQEEGLLGADAEKEWHTRDDSAEVNKDPQEACVLIDGVRVPLDEDFETDEGPIDAPPLHPHCRCSIRIIPGKVKPAEIPAEGRLPTPSEPVPPPTEIPEDVQALAGEDAEEIYGLIEQIGGYGVTVEVPDVDLLVANLKTSGVEAFRGGKMSDDRMKTWVENAFKTGVRDAAEAFEVADVMVPNGALKFYVDKTKNLYLTAFNGIRVNVASIAWQNEKRLAEFTRLDVASRHHPPGGAGKNIVHEIAHELQLQTELGRRIRGGRTFNLGPKGYETWTYHTFQPELERFLSSSVADTARKMETIAQQVSNYAASGPTEFVAEVFQGYKYGARYSAEVMDLYRALGGPVL